MKRVEFTMHNGDPAYSAWLSDVPGLVIAKRWRASWCRWTLYHQRSKKTIPAQPSARYRTRKLANEAAKRLTELTGLDWSKDEAGLLEDWERFSASFGMSGELRAKVAEALAVREEKV